MTFLTILCSSWNLLLQKNTVISSHYSSQCQLDWCNWELAIWVWSWHISVANLQNPFSVHLVKLRKRALKFLAHFSLVCLGKCPKAHEKWSQMEKLIWGYIFHPSGMLWRPFGGRFLRVLHPKGVFRSLFLRISCFYKSSKPLSGANAPGRGFDDLWLYSKCTGKGFWQWEGVLNVSKSSRGW